MRRLTRKQRRALEEYAAFGISLEQLRTVLGDAIEVDFGPHERKVLFHYDNRKPEVRIELRHIRDAMDRQARGSITTEQLSEWATMLLLNDAYRWDGKDEGEIAELLHEISALTLKHTQRAEQGES